MRIDVKKVLLTGTALVAVTAFGTQARAAGGTITSGASGTWAELSAGTGTNADIPHAEESASVNLLAGATLTVTNDNTANDGEGVDTFTLGDVTNTAGTGNITVVNGRNALLTTTINSANVGGNVSFSTINNALGAQTDGVTHALTVGGNLVVSNAAQATAADALALTVGGNTTVTGTTTITGGAFAGAATTAVTLNGASNMFMGAATVTGGANAGDTATLNLTGAATTFTAGLALTNARSALNVTDSAAQTITGAITGAGVVTVDNTQASATTVPTGTTFVNAVTAGSVVINHASGNSSATFQAAVTAPITLGGADAHAGDVNTVTFDGTTAGYTVTGAIAGNNATETNNINVIGGHTIVLGTASTANLSNLAVSGTGTVLTTGQNLTVAATTVGTGATLTTTVNLVSTNATLTGTGAVNLDGGAFTGNVVGATGAANGVLTDTLSGTLTGNATNLTAVNIAAGQTLTLTGNLGATTTTLTGLGSALTLNNAVSPETVTGKIAETITGDGTVNLAATAHTTAFAGDIGTSAIKVGTLAVAGNAGGTLTTTGNLYVNAITQGATDTLQLLGTSAQTVSGTVNGGIVTVGSAGGATSNVTFADVVAGPGAVTAVTGNVDAHAKATYDGNATYSGTYTNAGTTAVAAGKTLTVGTYGASTGTFETILTNTGGTTGSNSIGAVGSTVAVVNFSGQTVNVDVTSNAVATGAAKQQILASSTAGAEVYAADKPTAVTDNSYLYNFAVAQGTGGDANDLVLVASQNASANAGNSNNANSQAALDGGSNATTTNTQLLEVQNNIATAPNQSSYQHDVEATQPVVDGGNMVAAIGVTDSTFDITDARMADARTGADSTGMAAGNMAQGLKVWAQGFGQHADQDSRNGEAGYQANTYGGAAGVDSANILENGLLGIDFSYGRSDVDSRDANNAHDDIDSYQLTGYGRYDFSRAMFVNAMAAYAFDRNDQTRHDVGGVAGLDAGATYNANQAAARVDVGHDFAVVGNTILTPTVVGDYLYYNSDSYTESGAGGADLHVNQKTYNQADLGIDLKAGWEFKNADGSWLKPDVHAGYRYNLVNDHVGATSNFTAGGPAFSTEGLTPGRNTFDAGLDLKFVATTNWSLSASYDFQAKNNYTANTGLLRAAYKF